MRTEFVGVYIFGIRTLVKMFGIRDYTDEQIEAIVAGELAYCDTLNLVRVSRLDRIFRRNQKFKKTKLTMKQFSKVLASPC